MGSSMTNTKIVITEYFLKVTGCHMEFIGPVQPIQPVTRTGECQMLLSRTDLTLVRDV